MKRTQTEKAYLIAYHRAMEALKAVENMIHDLPAPQSDSLNWSHVGEMNRIAANLEEMQPEKP